MNSPKTPGFRPRLGLAIALSSLSIATSLPAAITVLRTDTIDSSAQLYPDSIREFGWTSNASGSDAIVSYGSKHYHAYYNSNGNLCIARRSPGSATITKIVFSATVTDPDSHRKPCIAISPNDGKLHIAFGHHNDPLRYIVSKGDVSALADTAFNTSAFNAERNYFKSGEPLSTVTYPTFTVGASNNLLVVWRDDGGSGNANYYMSEYATGAWSTERKINDGLTGTYNTTELDRCAYGGYKFRNGTLYNTFTWRETNNAATNHDLMFASSTNNGAAWKNNAAASITGAMNLNTSGLKVWTLDYTWGVANGFGMEIDSANNVHVVMRHYASNTSTTKRYWHYKRIGSTWTRLALPSTLAVDSTPDLMIHPTNDTLYLVALVAGKARIYSAPKGTNNWGTWTQEFESTNTYAANPSSFINGTGDRIFLYGQRTGATAESTSSALEVLTLGVN